MIHNAIILDPALPEESVERLLAMMERFGMRVRLEELSATDGYQYWREDLVLARDRVTT